MPELDISRMEEILREDPHFVRIIPAEEWKLPEIDYSMWPEDADGAVGSVENLTCVLNNVYYIDEFEGDHEKRRAWREALEKEHPGFCDPYNNNSVLKAGNFLTVKAEMSNLGDGYRGTNEPRFQKLRDDVTSLCTIEGETYGLLTNKEKVKYMKKVKKLVAGVLGFLAQQRPAFSE